MSFRKFSKHIFINILFALIIASVFVFFANHSKTVKAGVGDNVSGWAWSGNIGWISFNSTNCDPEGDGVDNATQKGKDCLDAIVGPGTGLTNNYGVNIDSNTGVFSGYAWSNNIGWIYLAPLGPYLAGPNYSVCVDLPGATSEPCNGLGDYNVDGWARACAVFKDGFCSGDTNLRPDYERGGWTGWIRMRGNFHGVWIEDTAVPDPEFRDYAWGSDDSNLDEAVIGWIRFNCKDGGNCGVSGHKVITTLAPTVNTAPSAIPSESAPDYCIVGPQRNLSWIFQDSDIGDFQTAYQVVLSDGSGWTLDSGKVISGSSIYTPTLSYGKTYTWTLQVWDSQDLGSGIINGPGFTMPPHAYPDVNFEWDPLSPVVGQRVQFCSVIGSISDDEDGDISTPPYTYNCLPVNPTVCYDASGPSTDGSKCKINGFSWIIPDFQYGLLSGPNFANPYGKFNVINDPSIITLTVEDKSGQSCFLELPLDKGLPLPEWREIAPF